MTRRPVLLNGFFHEKRVLELVFDLRGNVLKMLHTESTLKRKIVPAAIAVWRKSYRHGNAQGENKEKTRKGEGNKGVFLQRSIFLRSFMPLATTKAKRKITATRDVFHHGSKLLLLTNLPKQT